MSVISPGALGNLPQRGRRSARRGRAAAAAPALCAGRWEQEPCLHPKHDPAPTDHGPRPQLPWDSASAALAPRTAHGSAGLDGTQPWPKHWTHSQFGVPQALCPPRLAARTQGCSCVSAPRQGPSLPLAPPRGVRLPRGACPAAHGSAAAVPAPGTSWRISPNFKENFLKAALQLIGFCNIANPNVHKSCQTLKNNENSLYITRVF